MKLEYCVFLDVQGPIMAPDQLQAVTEKFDCLVRAGRPMRFTRSYSGVHIQNAMAEAVESLAAGLSADQEIVKVGAHENGRCP